MRVGVISDIHSNMAALFVVLLAFKQENVELVLNIGDVVGYYHKPKEVIALLKELKDSKKLISVMGNHDVAVAGFIFHDLFSADFIASLGEALIKSHNYNAQESWSWTITQLDKELTAFLLDETSKTIELEGLRIHMTHGAPSAMRGELRDEVGFYLTSKMIEAHQNDLEAFFQKENIDILITGHTHHPLHMVVGKTHIINPGSVGQSRDEDPRTSFLIMDLENKEIKNLQFYRLDYMIQDRYEAKFSSAVSDAENDLLSTFQIGEF